MQTLGQRNCLQEKLHVWKEVASKTSIDWLNLWPLGLRQGPTIGLRTRSGVWCKKYVEITRIHVLKDSHS